MLAYEHIIIVLFSSDIPKIIALERFSFYLKDLQLALAAEFRPLCSYSWKVPWLVGVESDACWSPAVGVMSTMSSSLGEWTPRPFVAVVP